MRHVGYDEFSQRVRLVYGNEVESRYTYDPLTRRLASLTTRTPAGAVLQALTYQYDRVGNVLGSRNAPPIQRFGGITLGPVEQSYRYDSLYRLVEASGRFEFAPGKVNRYSNLFTYDPIHNLTAKVQTHTIDQPSGTGVEQHETTYNLVFTYDGPQPHAATADGERTYQYDPNGNLVRWDDDRSGQRRVITWTEENRVRSVADNGRTTTFRYNDAGERVLKRGRFGETVWVNQYFTVRNAEVATKHVFAGELRVASQLVRQGGNLGRRPVTRGPGETRESSTPVVGEPVLVAAAGPLAVPSSHAPTPDAPTDALVVAQAAMPAADPSKGRGRDRAEVNPAAARAAESGRSPNGPPPGQAKRLDDAGTTAPHGQGRPAWTGPHETRGLERALEVGRGKKLGLQERDGGGNPGGGAGGGPGTGAGTGRGKDSPAIEGPYRPQEFQLFFYHGDHLGSANVVTDAWAEPYEHVEYFPFGEPWVDQGGTATLLPYKFTSKELDPETGLYYYGARYYEPRLSRWLSADPAFEAYLAGAPNLGVYLPANLAVYTYSYQNPVKYRDPEGEVVESPWDVANVVLGAVSLAANVAAGNYGDAAIDAVGLIADVAATVVPGVPGGAGTAIKVARAGRAAARGLETAGDVKQAARALGEGAEALADAGRAAARSGDEVVDAGQAARRQGGDLTCSSVPGTLVATPEGPVPIETLAVGDLVVARDEATGEQDTQRVLRAYGAWHDAVLVLEVVTADGGVERLVTTEEHPFWVEGTGWVPAGELLPGDRLATAAGPGAIVVAATRVATPRLTYNLTVEAAHTFFVGQAGLWVHNDCPVGVRFGQESVSSRFSHGPFAGKTIGEVAEGLRAGRIAPDDLPIEVVVRNGEQVALNNRSLLALRRAGMEPTKIIDRTGVPEYERLLDKHLRGGTPSDHIRVRGGPPNTSSIE